jgi:D-3-phosphoglycerate dehydrogenase
MTFKILIADAIHIKGIMMLKEAGFHVEPTFGISRGELLKKISEFDVLIVRSRTKVTRDVIEAAERLKIIGRAGVGLDNVAVDIASENKIKVLNTPRAPSIAVAELVFALLLAHFRNIPRACESLKRDKWIKSELVGRELRGKTIGIIGFGSIGREISSRAKAFGMYVITIKHRRDIRREAASLGVKIAPNLGYMLQKSDIISINVPLTKSTFHLISEKEFSMMKDGAYIINTSRGAIVDERALLKALKSGKLAGAALDSFKTEPPKGIDSEIVKLHNVIATPHIAASTIEAQEAAGTTIAMKVISTLLGESEIPSLKKGDGI